MSVPKVSIIILTYNRKDLVLNAVRSVLNQTYQDYQLLVIDDGSTDDTLLNLARICYLMEFTDQRPADFLKAIFFRVSYQVKLFYRLRLHCSFGATV